MLTEPLLLLHLLTLLLCCKILQQSCLSCWKYTMHILWIRICSIEEPRTKTAGVCTLFTQKQHFLRVPRYRKKVLLQWQTCTGAPVLRLYRGQPSPVRTTLQYVCVTHMQWRLYAHYVHPQTYVFGLRNKSFLIKTRTPIVLVRSACLVPEYHVPANIEGDW